MLRFYYEPFSFAVLKKNCLLVGSQFVDKILKL